MKALEKNISNLYGQKGREWLDKLPVIIKELSDRWSLTQVKAVNNMSWNFVATAIQDHKIPIVLKISCGQQLIQHEYNSLKHFDGHGAIQVLDINAEYHALLLERAMPGERLKEHHPEKLTDTIVIYASIVKQLASRPFSKRNTYTHVSEWLSVLDKITDPRIEKCLVDKARPLRSILLKTAKQEYLCHGDLHLENIISHGSTWVAIDPKGIIGEIAFEAAAFDLISIDEIQQNGNIPSLVLNRVELLSNSLALNFNRLLSWIFLRIILSAQWFIEDNGDPSFMLTLAKHVYPLVKVTY